MAKSPLGKGLGKGLGSLITPKANIPLPPTASPMPREDHGERIQQIRLDQIVPSPLQPRVEFREDQLQDLVSSIREQGIIQPLIVRKVAGRYELIAGERRFRASTQLGLIEVPGIVRQATDQEVVELALIENLQREGLNPIEEASAYARLAKEFHLTQEEISRRVGKSRAAVANAMRLLELDSEVRELLIQGHLSVGHAKVLLGLKNKEEQRLFANQIIRRSASVRIAEEMVSAQLARAQGSQRKQSKSHTSTAHDLPPALLHLQNKLQHRFATRVILHHNEKKGHISIEYYGSDDLGRLMNEFGISAD